MPSRAVGLWPGDDHPGMDPHSLAALCKGKGPWHGPAAWLSGDAQHADRRRELGSRPLPSPGPTSWVPCACHATCQEDSRNFINIEKPVLRLQEDPGRSQSHHRSLKRIPGGGEGSLVHLASPSLMPPSWVPALAADGGSSCPGPSPPSCRSRGLGGHALELGPGPWVPCLQQQAHHAHPARRTHVS